MSHVILSLMFASASGEFNLPTGLLDSLCFIESSHNIKAIHKDDGGSNSVGICQLKYKTAKWLGFKGTEKDLMDPQTNIYFSAKYLHYQISRYNDIERAVVAYNIGNAKGLANTAYSDKVFKQWRQTSNVRSKFTCSKE